MSFIRSICSTEPIGGNKAMQVARMAVVLPLRLAR